MVTPPDERGVVVVVVAVTGCVVVVVEPGCVVVVVGAGTVVLGPAGTVVVVDGALLAPKPTTIGAGTLRASAAPPELYQ